MADAIAGGAIASDSLTERGMECIKGLGVVAKSLEAIRGIVRALDVRALPGPKKPSGIVSRESLAEAVAHARVQGFSVPDSAQLVLIKRAIDEDFENQAFDILAARLCIKAPCPWPLLAFLPF